MLIFFSAKYALATVNQLIDVFGEDQLIGYDIGCSFSSTIASSSIAVKAHENQLVCCVNAFHGHAHKRLCQLSHHPLYLRGVGLEDLETCERVFSALNAATQLIHHASFYHWLQYLDLHFNQWDQDRYQDLSTTFFSFDNSYYILSSA